MLSLHTNYAALSAQNSLSKTQAMLSTSQTRLSTGFRINSAMDDAAGLQIATRLKTQTSGMMVAMRNTQNATSLLQTAEGAFSGITDMLTRMKDLATQAADASSSDDDRTAMQSEYDALGQQITQIMANTTFGKMNLLADATVAGGAGVLSKTGGMTFQIGANKADTFTLDISVANANSATGFDTLQTALTAISTNYKTDGSVATAAGAELTGGIASANGMLATIDDAIKQVGATRSSLGATANRLDDVYNNLQNMSTNVTQATSRIMDVDYASETANMTSQTMLMQAGTAMLKQTGQMSQMVMSLLQ